MIGRLFATGKGPIDLDAIEENVCVCFFGKKFQGYVDFNDDGVMRISIHKCEDPVQGCSENLVQGISIDANGDIYHYFGAQSEPGEYKEVARIVTKQESIDIVEKKRKEIDAVESL